MVQKSYSESKLGKMYLVPTPIGNIEDITFRAISILKEVDIIYAEDTRVAQSLLKKFDIKKKVFSCHKYSEEKNKKAIYDEILSGKNIAYTSDRGTPLISDPGEVVVKYLISNNVDVISLPGPSALLPAINVSGLDNSKFVFYGFLNSKKSTRISELKKIAHLPFTIIFYEAPHRLLATLNDIKDTLGNRNIAVCREISKLYEEVFRGKVDDAVIYYKEPKGEIVLVVEGNESVEEVDYIEKVKELVSKGYKVSNAIKEIAVIYGISKNDLYSECKEKLLWN